MAKLTIIVGKLNIAYRVKIQIISCKRINIEKSLISLQIHHPCEVVHMCDTNVRPFRYNLKVDVVASSNWKGT